MALDYFLGLNYNTNTCKATRNKDSGTAEIQICQQNTSTLEASRDVVRTSGGGSNHTYNLG